MLHSQSFNIQASTKENSKNLAKKALVYLTQYVEMKESLFIDIPDKLQICTYTWVKINKQEGAFTKVA